MPRRRVGGVVIQDLLCVLCGPLRSLRKNILNAEIAEGRRDRIYEATMDVKNFFRHTFVLTPAASMNWFSCPLLFDMKLSCKKTSLAILQMSSGETTLNHLCGYFNHEVQFALSPQPLAGEAGCPIRGTGMLGLAFSRASRAAIARCWNSA